MRDDKRRTQKVYGDQVTRENMKLHANQIDVHDLESTNIDIGENYMSNVSKDDGHYKYKQLSTLQIVQYTISGALLLGVVIYAIIKAATSYLGDGW